MLTIIDIRKRKKIFENLKSFLNSFNRSEKHKLHKIKKMVVSHDHHDTKETL